MEQSSLTGESEPVECFLEHQHDEAIEAKNVVFNSCLVVEGEGYGVVIRTGDATFIGSIAKQSSATTVPMTTLRREVKRFVFFIFILSAIMAAILFIIGMAERQNILFVFINGVLVVFVANVPEGKKKNHVLNFFFLKQLLQQKKRIACNYYFLFSYCGSKIGKEKCKLIKRILSFFSKSYQCFRSL